MRWGFAGPWYWELQLAAGETKDGIRRQLQFAINYGLELVDLPALAVQKLEPAQRETLAASLQQHGKQGVAMVGFDYLKADDSTCRRETDTILEALRANRAIFGGTIVTTGPHAGHRFDRTLPLEAKLAKLSRALGPLAAGCAELGTPLAIENHGDFYVSDLIQLCRMTPGLRLFLDTGNTFLIGERPDRVWEEAAPFVAGTHFKDHRVQPNPQTLMFEIGGAALGDGDCDLRGCHDALLRLHPDPKSICMIIEMVAPKGTDPLACWNQSLAFARSL